MSLGNYWAVLQFELRRSFTLARMLWWGVLALFPVFITTLICMSPLNAPLPPEPWAFFLFAVIPMLVTMLGTLLWATPVVSAELERKSWVYLAVRPDGSSALLIGKYLATVLWVLPAALVGLTLSVLVAYFAGDFREGIPWLRALDVATFDEEWMKASDALRIWTTIAILSCLSCPAYAAVYLLIGTLFPKRSMVLAVAYTLIFELIVGLIPAMINKLTVQYRLRALLVDWANIPFEQAQQLNVTALIGDSPAWVHVAVLLAYTLALLVAAVALIRWCEFTTAAEAEV